MLNPFKLKTSLAPLVLLLLASVAHAEGGDHGSGNGGDGLQLFSVQPLGDVVVSPPSEFAFGTLKVVGEEPLQEGRSEGFWLLYCQTDAAGMVLRGSCEWVNHIDPSVQNDVPYHINQEVTLRVGTYYIHRSDAEFLKVRIDANERKIITLSKIQVPRPPVPGSDGVVPVQYFVVSDLSDARAQHRFLERAFDGAIQQRAFQAECARNHQPWCSAVLTGPMDSIVDRLVRFTADGRVDQIYLRTGAWLGPNWDYVRGDYRFLIPWGESVQVLPGTYAIIFKDTQTGQMLLQRGVVVD